MDSQLLVGARVFMDALREHARGAQNRLYIQAMTFEGDAAGEELIDLMINSPAKDKRLIVDSFSKVVVSDYFVFGPRYLFDRTFRMEIGNTKKLIAKARSYGVQVKFVNPTGWLMTKYPLRNHKKMMIVDSKYSYLGGINFSDHNFSWHDMMILLHHDFIAQKLEEDFLQTWNGSNQSIKHPVEHGSLYLLNGVRSKGLYQEFFKEFDAAAQEITVISPYVSEPLLFHLRIAAKRGVKVKIISPAQNNKGLFQKYLLNELKHGYFELFHFPGMFHLKAILIDNSKLIFGSSNYDLVSYYFEQEVVVVSSQDQLVESFKEFILSKFLSESEKIANGKKSWGSQVLMSLLAGFGLLMSSTLLKPK